jgi:hydrogenase maturation protease
LRSLAAAPLVHEFTFTQSETLRGQIDLRAIELAPRLFRLTVVIRNCETLSGTAAMTRDDVLLRSFVSVHSILHATGCEFISLLDPPDRFQDAAAACQNKGAWPVLAGDERIRDTMLCSPIILYDYPQIAPESAGDLFDGTEIDEILALRILTMTDAEKLEVRNGDDRARRILERTELLPPEHFQKLHGALRGLAIPTEAQQ